MKVVNIYRKKRIGYEEKVYHQPGVIDSLLRELTYRQPNFTIGERGVVILIEKVTLILIFLLYSLFLFNYMVFL